MAQDYIHIVELVQSGEIGQIIAIQAQWNRNGNWRRQVFDPNLNVKLIGECTVNILMDLLLNLVHIKLIFIGFLNQLQIKLQVLVVLIIGKMAVKLMIIFI